MIHLVRSFLAPLASLAVLIVSSGLFNTFVSIRLEIEGYRPEAIGIVTSALYAGLLAGSFKIDRLILRLGHAHSFILFALVLTLLVLFQAYWIDPWVWSALRFIGGICIGGVFIVIESWLLMQTPQQQRGKILSIYLAVFYGALSAGQLLIDCSDPAGYHPFYITAGLCALSVLPVWLFPKSAPKQIEQSAKLSFSELFALSPLGFMGGVISGMILAVVYGLIPVYAKEQGMSLPEIGTFMAVLILGGLSLQWPLAHWADQGNRRKVLNTASLCSAVFAAILAFSSGASPTLLLILAWFFGGFAFTIYPLSMAYTCEKVQEQQIVAATGGFVLSYAIGAIAGPLLAPLAMTYFGGPGIFYFLSIIALLLCVMGLRFSADKSV